VERRDREARCVFCGRAIAPDEPSVGRGAVAAHAACADRSLGDERSWDRIAAALGDVASEDEPAADGDPDAADRTGRNGGDTSDVGVASTSGHGPGAAARTGCMTIAVLVALVAWSVAGRERGSRNGG
jgi:hypothetical protein